MRTLQGAIAEERVGHAYLFCGPRGTGKTTTARILAKALLCERGPTSEPCLACDQCKDTESGANVDVIEFDAASNTGVDDVRMLKEAVGFAPMRARFKIYIIDEVHMMSKAAFNALLKTLEEPPAHVKFLFATTELDKVLETVRSRCQVVRLSLIPEARIAAHLDGVLAKEGIAPEPGVTAELARFARGSLRDGLSITDQLLALVGDRPTVEDVRRVAPQGGAEQVERILSLVEKGERAALLSVLPRTDGGEAELCGALLSHLRLGLLCLLCPADAQLHEPDAELRTRMSERARRLGPDRLQLWLEELLHARERMELLPQQARIVLEVTLLDLCRPETTLPLHQLEQRLLALEARLASGGPPRPPLAPAPPSAPPAHASAAVASEPRPTVEAARASPTPAPVAPASAPPPPPASAAPIPPPAPKPPVPASPPPPAPARPAAPAPARALPPATPAARPAPAARERAPQGVWGNLLAELAKTHAEAAEVLKRRGTLAETTGSRATIQLQRLLEPERALLADSALRATLEALLARSLARPVQLVLDDPATRAAGSSDPFTREVAELFGGLIEDNA
jgi:DNA polymerase-3 subunit gamma/tau